MATPGYITVCICLSKIYSTCLYTLDYILYLYIYIYICGECLVYSCINWQNDQPIHAPIHQSVCTHVWAPFTSLFTHHLSLAKHGEHAWRKANLMNVWTSMTLWCLECHITVQKQTAPLRGLVRKLHGKKETYHFQYQLYRLYHASCSKQSLIDYQLIIITSSS